MEEDDEGNVSLGPDLTEGHRRSCTGALGWPAAGGGERRGVGARGEEEGVRVPSPRPDPLIASTRRTGSTGDRPVLPPARDFQTGEPLKFPRGRKYR